MHEQEGRHAAEVPLPSKQRSRRRFLAGAVTGGILGSLLAGSVSVFSQVNQRPGWWSHAGHGGWFGRRHDPEMIGERMGFTTDWVMRRINASEAQQQQVKAIVQKTLNDLLPLREQHQAQHQAVLEALKQPTIDRQTLEELRLAKMQLAETASSRFVEAIGDIAEVLTPEQRAELVGLAGRLHH